MHALPSWPVFLNREPQLVLLRVSLSVCVLAEMRVLAEVKLKLLSSSFTLSRLELLRALQQDVVARVRVGGVDCTHGRFESITA